MAAGLVLVLFLASRAPATVAQLPAPVSTGSTGTFDQSDNLCGDLSRFVDRFDLTIAPNADGPATLAILQPSTGSLVTGPIAPDGTFTDVRNDAEQFVNGLLAGNVATATYRYTHDGCTQTWAARFALDAPLAVPVVPPPTVLPSSTTRTAPPTTAAPTTTAPLSTSTTSDEVAAPLPGGPRHQGRSQLVATGIVLEITAVVLLWAGRRGRPARLRAVHASRDNSAR
jgi:hypothetical protein